MQQFVLSQAAMNLRSELLLMGWQERDRHFRWGKERYWYKKSQLTEPGLSAMYTLEKAFRQMRKENSGI